MYTHTYGKNRWALGLAASLLFWAATTCHAIQFEVNQIDWLGDGTVADTDRSDWGQVNVLFDATDIANFHSDGSGGYFGFLNVTASTGSYTGSWAVQNAALAFRDSGAFDSRLHDSYWFDISGGLATGPGTFSDLVGQNVTLELTIDSSPVSSAPASGTVSTTVSIGSFDAAFGGILFDGASYTGNATPAKAQNHEGAAAGTSIADGGAIFGKEADVEKVNEHENGCAPGSAARSIKYLAAQHASVNEGDPIKDVYDTLRDASHMKTGVGKNGSGTTTSNFLAGKVQYTTEKRQDIKTKQTTDVKDAIEVLKKKGDVELMVYWGKNDKGKSLGGHAAFISAVTLMSDGSYEVTIIDDATQGDGTAANNKHTLKFDKDGSLSGFGTGAKLLGFQVEVVPEPPTPLLLGIGLLAILLYRQRVLS